MLFFQALRICGKHRKICLISSMKNLDFKQMCAPSSKMQSASASTPPEQNGLKQIWTGVCWCNPPYGRGIEKWMKKAYESNATVVCLVPARTDTKWFHDFVLGKAEIRFIRGRLKFGNSKNSAPFPSMLVIYRKDGMP